jgi:phosphatidylserine decarboxylase
MEMGQEFDPAPEILYDCLMSRWREIRERVGIDLLRLAPKGTLSQGIGWISRRRVPRPLRRALYEGFAHYTGADLSALDRPLETFERFDEFFTRPLPEGARQVVANERAVASPVDGLVSEVGLAEAGRMIQAKGRGYSVAGLLGDQAKTTQFEGGAYATLYLAPADYHRVHAPVGGHVTGYRHLPGTFFPVNSQSTRHIEGLFTINERLVTYLESTIGRVAVVKVAATGVGHITVSYDPSLATHQPWRIRRTGRAMEYSPPRPIQRGAELGVFHLGSTVILLFQKGRVELELARGQRVRVGQRIGAQVTQAASERA